MAKARPIVPDVATVPQTSLKGQTWHGQVVVRLPQEAPLFRTVTAFREEATPRKVRQAKGSPSCLLSPVPAHTRPRRQGKNTVTCT